MTETKEKEATVSAQPVAKKARRGVSNQTQAVAQLRFHEKDASPANGLFVGHLEEVKVDWSTNENSKQFAGVSVPRFTLHFASNHTNASERRHVYQTLFPVESNVNTIPGGSEEWKVNSVFNWLKHMLDVFYLKGREMTESEEEALSLPFVDFDDNGEYVAVDEETVANGYAYIFNNAAAMLNGSFNLANGEVAKPCYKSADGKNLPCWIKLLRHKKNKNKWINVGQNGELGFDNFIGNGVVELVRKDMPPAVLRIDLSRESINPKEVDQKPSIGIPGIGNTPMGSVVAGSPMNMGMSDATGAFNAAADDMPF